MQEPEIPTKATLYLGAVPDEAFATYADIYLVLLFPDFAIPRGCQFADSSRLATPTRTDTALTRSV
jgi:hypothetical protein